MKEKELILYRNLSDEEILKNVVYLAENSAQGEWGKDKEFSSLYDVCSKLITLSGSLGFYGNLWHCYLTYLLVHSENIYSISCEKSGGIDGTVNEIALHDFQIFFQFYNYDFHKVFKNFDEPLLHYMLAFENKEKKVGAYNARICDCICQTAKRLSLAQSAEEMKDIMEQFYKSYGVGKFGLHKAFRIKERTDTDDIEIVPILNVAHVYLDDLVGYEIPKQKLIANTEAFVEGRQANNCLLFGDAGTGKSSCVKAILNEYYDNGLRIIEIYKHQFDKLYNIIEQIKDRQYKFIIYMDDLSFEEFETEYKYLKAIIEGGLESKPDNVLIYATSNRRHLIRESYKDKAEWDEEMHTSDTVQEKLSLVNRFGVTIFFSAPNKKEFQNIVNVLAKRHGITIKEEELLLEANKWELSHGGLSGRTAVQFINYLLGKVETEMES